MELFGGTTDEVACDANDIGFGVIFTSCFDVSRCLREPWYLFVITVEQPCGSNVMESLLHLLDS